MRVLAGDIGGTNARFLVAEVEGDSVRPLLEHQVPSADHPGPAAALRAAAAETGYLEPWPARACLAVAGPVNGTTARVTNLPWSLDATAIAAELDIPRVELINDFTAVGEGLPALTGEQRMTLLPGEPQTRAPQAYLGAGTGLGMGWRIPCDDGHVVVASEGGHAGFAPRTPTERDLLDHWQARLGRVHRETLLSGPGLARIAEYLREGAGRTPGEDLARELDEAADPAAVIGRAGMAGDDPLAVEALTVFAEIYGSMAGDIGLEAVATGGVYLAGGIAPRMAAFLQGPAFREAFLDKGAMRHLAERLPVYLVTEPRVGLLGAARRAARPRTRASAG